MRIMWEGEFEPEKVKALEFKGMWDKIVAAGKEGEFRDWLDRRFWGCLPRQDEVVRIAVKNKGEIYHSLGLDEDGNPIKGKKFGVFLRVTCVVKEEVIARNPEEAREKAMRQWDEDDGDPLFCADRSDIQEVEPVAYDEGDGNTKDFDS